MLLWCALIGAGTVFLLTWMGPLACNASVVGGASVFSAIWRPSMTNIGAGIVFLLKYFLQYRAHVARSVSVWSQMLCLRTRVRDLSDRLVCAVADCFSERFIGEREGGRSMRYKPQGRALTRRLKGTGRLQWTTSKREGVGSILHEAHGSIACAHSLRAAWQSEATGCATVPGEACDWSVSVRTLLHDAFCLHGNVAVGGRDKYKCVPHMCVAGPCLNQA